MKYYADGDMQDLRRAFEAKVLSLEGEPIQLGGRGERPLRGRHLRGGFRTQGLVGVIQGLCRGNRRSWICSPTSMVIKSSPTSTHPSYFRFVGWSKCSAVIQKWRGEWKRHYVIFPIMVKSCATFRSFVVFYPTVGEQVKRADGERGCPSRRTMASEARGSSLATVQCRREETGPCGCLSKREGVSSW